MLSVSTLGKTIAMNGKTGKNSKKAWLFKNVTLDVHAGEMVALMGQSGSGKSTLLNCMSGLAPADEGTCQVDGNMLSNVSKRHLRRNLRNHVSLIFQDHHLIPGLTLLQNVQLARSLSDATATNAQPQQLTPDEALDRLGIGPERNSLPESVSGGQAQRAAIARSLVTSAQVIFADEPTGALDGENIGKVLTEMRRACHEMKTHMVVVTHDHAVAAACDRTLLLEGGTVHASDH
ncbi:ABC transporter ATP-binding protein [Corynebacterium durum]|uniref:ABC transporter ATP-binding protein n=1 Tax=Corynebacterium durum TaxID=61592 RepID=UPI0015C8727D|nr:ATP-binding cassette domain-containing protein [Corynebacterium durum]NYI74679.1 ABC-type lipoprotein export system ATPase subunit [Corynebacterium durum]WJY83821.1 Bacitracin export ATP-binding protein BceA [Corynebacterium durum]